MTRPTFPRREFMRLSAAAAAGVALAPALGGARIARAGEGEMLTRPIPSSGERLPVIGLGTNAYGVDTEEEIAPLREVLREMPGLGGSVIDTARVYGRSEEVLGELMAELGNRDEFFVASKTPIRGELGDPDEEFAVSLQRLGIEQLDLMKIHNLHGTAHLMPALLRAKDAGRVRYIGISTNVDVQYEELMAAMREYPLDFIQCDYSIDNRSAADELLPLAADQGIAVMINMPFGGRTRAASTFAHVADRELPDWAADIDATSWAQVFLKYVISHPDVTVVIPGTTSVRHLRDNQAAGRGRLPDENLRREMASYWDRITA